MINLRRTGTAEEGIVAVEQAWAELAALEQEQERSRSERSAAERELETVRQRGAALEDVILFNDFIIYFCHIGPDSRNFLRGRAAKKSESS
jgi:hypothetical protein